MKKVLLALMVTMAGTLAHASTITNIWDGLTAEPHATLGESVLPIFAYDFHNGTSRAGGVTAFYKFGPFSLDAGVLSPLDAGQTGTPVLGGSIHVDQLVRVISPSINDGLRSLFPQSASKLLDALVIGVAPIHNFNTPDNQDSLILSVYSGLELRF